MKNTQYNPYNIKEMNAFEYYINIFKKFYLKMKKMNYLNSA